MYSVLIWISLHFHVWERIALLHPWEDKAFESTRSQHRHLHGEGARFDHDHTEYAQLQHIRTATLTRFTRQGDTSPLGVNLLRYSFYPQQGSFKRYSVAPFELCAKGSVT